MEINKINILGFFSHFITKQHISIYSPLVLSIANV
jgi:hypothetical protein